MAEMAGWSLPTRLAFSGAIEHLTAVLSAEILHKQGAWLVQGTTSQSRLWRWHCEEELGHRDVLPNILYAASISRLRRKLAFAAAALYFAADLAWTLAIMCRCDWKAGRIGMGQLGWQAIKFGVKATPNLIRMTWQSLQYLFK